jgi:Nif-specific regulatory protein
VEKVEVSRTIVRRVLKDNVGILSNEVPSTDVFRSAESLLVPKVHSVLAVPLEAFERVHGVIYVDTSAPDASFDEGHLHVLTAIARIAATALENARQWESLEGENRRLRDEISGEYNMVGESPAIEEVYRFIHRVADKDSTVLIWGESGTGKELVARAIHRNSDRALKPFIAINCAALPEALLESELFGHEKGSFTGAVGQKLGKLEVAEGGTVFLDEIGELAPMLQAKLLRVLQEREFERVGGTRPIKLNIRLIAATNRDLKKASISGTYRQDLYYRLNVVSVRMPALRERREDIPLLAAFFAQKHGAKAKRLVSGISSGARYALMDYDWPGNVRELENAIERAVVMGSSDLILPEDLPEAILERGQLDSSAASGGFHEGVIEAKKQLILKALDKSSGNYNEAAQLLGVHPNYLHRLITNLNLRARKQRGPG